MSVGVIGHLPNPSPDEAVTLATASEGAGADWIGLADAFWWRDVWLLLGELARATTRIELGPAMTNAYLRHPFHTLSALATLQDLAGERVFLGLAAGGSELSLAAGVDRADAPARVGALADLARRVAAGAPLDEASGRHLDVPLRPAPVLVAGGKPAVQVAAGACADRVLVWATARSELAGVIARVRGAAEAAGRAPTLIWAPLVAAGEGPVPDHVAAVAVYAALNAPVAAQRRWGLDRPRVEAVRRELVAGRPAEARALVPGAVFDDLVLRGEDAMPAAAGALARQLGVGGVAVPGFSVEGVGEQVAWASAVLAVARA
ncbi:MAG: LLM class flavin-dependent oxidoreductase [Acidimicrobiia bacterium]|nr:LLM class flavin-dependent oxidoreductase [Acidimicrobiia bacterium]